MAKEPTSELASRIAEMEAITERYRGLDSYDEPSIYSRKQIMSEISSDFDRISVGMDEQTIQYLADDHVRLLAQLSGKPEQQELARFIGNAMSANAVYKGAVEQRAAAFASSFGWALPGEQFKLTIEAALAIEEREALNTTLGGEQLPADQDPELIALAEKVEGEVGLAGIRKRADAFAGSVSQFGLAAAKETITLDVARDWVAADVRDFGFIEETSHVREAATVILVNAGKVGLYGQELRTTEPALSESLKGMAAPLEKESSIKQRDQAEGKFSTANQAKIRANEDALEIVLGCDTSEQGLAVVTRNMNHRDYRDSFNETVREFIALNEDGPFYDAERFWTAQQIIHLCERKEYLRQGGEPELSDWEILLSEVLQKQRRPLSGAEFKDVVFALERAARDAASQKAEIHRVVGLLAKVHGASGESLFRDTELRGAYRDGLRTQSDAGPIAASAPAMDASLGRNMRPSSGLRP